MPDEFDALTIREFDLKHAAFTRAENRRESELLRLALRIGQFDKGDRRKLTKAAVELKQYPLKEWLLKPRRHADHD